MARTTPWLTLAAVALFAAGCSNAKAQVLLPDAAPLAMPTPPAHVVMPAAPEPIPVPTVEVPVQSTPPAAINGNQNRGRTDPPPSRPAAPPATPPATAPAAAPATPTPLEAAAKPSELEQNARTLRDSADRALEKIDYKALSDGGKAQYDTAKRFIRQADDALKAKNIVYAWQLADKANTIATLLK